MSALSTAAFRRYADGCPYRLTSEVERRPANALNLEIGAPLPRCRLRLPREWKGRDMAARWLASGGTPFVFGLCSRACPLRPDFCEDCGHRRDMGHALGACRSGSCGCEAFRSSTISPSSAPTPGKEIER